jgi:DNA polymerase iota
VNDLEQSLFVYSSPRLLGPSFEICSPFPFFRLWNLLWAIDEDLVQASSDYPKQISVEDSYDHRKPVTFDAVVANMGTLALSLLTRLELELFEPVRHDDEQTQQSAKIDDSSCPSPPIVGKRRWARYPTQVRLSVQLGERRRSSSRQSKSAPAPAFIFDTQTDRRERADALTKKVLTRLFRELVGNRSSAVSGPPLHVSM